MRFVLIPVISVCGCYSSFADFADERDDGGVEDVGGAEDVGADRDADAAADADADVDDGGLVPCAGGWYDGTSGLCWQDPPHDVWMTWSDAVAYCGRFSSGDYGPGSWLLPTISELRSLVRGCPETGPGGACGVTDSCAGVDCWNDACYGCEPYVGPAGCYWPAGLGGRCDWFWSSSLYAGSYSNVLIVGFVAGMVVSFNRTDTFYVRCVRPGP